MNPHNNFLSLTPSHLLKLTKFFVKIYQFKFLLMAEKNIFVYKLFLSLNISDFGLFFKQKLQPSENGHSPDSFQISLRSNIYIYAHQ